MVNVLQMLLGDPNQRQLNKLKPYVALINSLEAEYQGLSDEQLQLKPPNLSSAWKREKN